jgi:hypothetical protein
MYVSGTGDSFAGFLQYSLSLLLLGHGSCHGERRAVPRRALGSDVFDVDPR